MGPAVNAAESFVFVVLARTGEGGMCFCAKDASPGSMAVIDCISEFLKRVTLRNNGGLTLEFNPFVKSTQGFQVKNLPC